MPKDFTKNTTARGESQYARHVHDARIAQERFEAAVFGFQYTINWVDLFEPAEGFDVKKFSRLRGAIENMLETFDEWEKLASSTLRQMVQDPPKPVQDVRPESLLSGTPAGWAWVDQGDGVPVLVQTQNPGGSEAELDELSDLHSGEIPSTVGKADPKFEVDGSILRRTEETEPDEKVEWNEFHKETGISPKNH